MVSRTQTNYPPDLLPPEEDYDNPSFYPAQTTHRAVERADRLYLRLEMAVGERMAWHVYIRLLAPLFVAATWLGWSIGEGLFKLLTWLLAS